MHNPNDTNKDYDVEPSELIGKSFKSDKQNNKQDPNKNQEDKELEKEIKDFEDNLLPNQDLEPEHALELSNHTILPPVEQVLIKEKAQVFRKDELDKQKDQEKKQEVEKLKKLKKQEKLQLKKDKKAKKLNSRQAKILQKEKKAKQKQIDKLLTIEEKRKQKFEQRQIKEIEKHKQKVANIFKQQEIKSQKKIIKQTRPKLNFSWYVNLIKKPVIYLAGIEMLVYFFSLAPNFKLNFFDFSLTIILLVDVIVLGWLVIKVIKTKVQTRWVAIKTVVLAGIFVGLFRAIFKLIWFNSAWTVPNIVIEPIMMAGIGLVAGIVASVVVRNEK